MCWCWIVKVQGSRGVCIRVLKTRTLVCRIGSEFGLNAADENEVKVPRILWRTDFGTLGTPGCPFFSNVLLLLSFTGLPAFLVSPVVAAPCLLVSAWASKVTSLLPSTCAPTSSALDSVSACFSIGSKWFMLPSAELGPLGAEVDSPTPGTTVEVSPSAIAVTSATGPVANVAWHVTDVQCHDVVFSLN